MKKLRNISLFVAIILLSACSNQTSEPFNYECPIPDDIPKVYPSGQPVPWDCIWSSYYNAGRVKVLRDSTGKVLGLVRYEYKDD